MLLPGMNLFGLSKNTPPTTSSGWAMRLWGGLSILQEWDRKHHSQEWFGLASSVIGSTTTSTTASTSVRVSAFNHRWWWTGAYLHRWLQTLHVCHTQF
jgi:hypothetical protein